MKVLARSWIALLVAVTVMGSLTATAGTSLANEGPKPDIFTPGPANKDGGQDGRGPSQPFGADKGRDHEIVSMRTRESNTFLNKDGTYDTDLYTGAVNYKDSQGRFQAIDNTLVPDAAAQGFRNRANDYVLHLPRDMGAAPTRIEKDGHWLSLSLEGARGEGSVRDNKATYEEVMPGVDAEITVSGEQVKEDLLLASSDAPSEFVYQLRTSPALTASVNDVGDVVFGDGNGTTVFTIPAPVVYDSADPDPEYASDIAWQLDAGPGVNSTLALSLSRGWLEDPARVFPVVVDPTVQTNYVQRDCTIDSGAPSSSLCYASTLEVGTHATAGMGGGMNYRRRRVLLYFDTAAFPQKVEVLNAEIGMWLLGSDGSGSSPILMREMKRSWTTNATWDGPDGTSTLWPGGGDFDPNNEPHGYDGPSTANLNPNYGFKHWWYPTKLVDRWIGKPLQNNGVILKPSNDNVDQILRFHSNEGGGTYAPRLTVNYDAKGLGQQKNFSYEEMSLTDRMDVKSNVGSGNMLLHAQDLHIKGTGLDLSVDRYFNNLVETTGLPGSGTLGNGWTLNVGSDIGLKKHGDGSVTYFGPSGYRLPFVKTGYEATGFKHPPGVDATLTWDASTEEYTLRMHKTLEKRVFDKYGYLRKHSDNNGHTITFDYNMGNNLTKITDTRGGVTLFDYSSGRLSQITDPVGRTYKYGYTQNNLTSYTNPQNFTTTYEYDSRNELTKVTDALGNQTTFTYLWTGIGAGQQIPPAPRRIASWTRVINLSDGTGDRTEFSYPAPDINVCCQTTVKDARNNSTKYQYDYDGRIRRVVDAHGKETNKSYNSMGNVESYTNAKGGQFSFTYDSTGEDLTTSLAPAESTGGPRAADDARYGLNDEELKHLPTCTIDAQGHQTYFEYFETPAVLKGELKAVYLGATGNLGGEGKDDDCRNAPSAGNYVSKTSYTYTPGGDGFPAGLLKTVTDGRGNVTTYDYFSNGNLQHIDYPHGDGGDDALDVAYTYDSLGRMDSMFDARGNLFRYAYDALDRLTQITYPNGSTLVYTYDLNGNKTNRKETSNATTIWEYNSKNELKKRTNPDGSFSTFTYDAVGNLTTTTDSRLPDNKRTTSYQYDAVNNLDTMWEPDRQNQPITFEQDELYMRTKTSYPNEVVWTRSYTKGGQLLTDHAFKEGDSANPLMDLKYDYVKGDKWTSLVQKVTDNVSNPKVITTYTYDKLNRLEKSLVNEQSSAQPPPVFDEFNYTYDENSNMLSRRKGTAAVRKYVYNQANQMVCSHTTTVTDCNTSDPSKFTVGYDMNGNMSSLNSGAASWGHNATGSTDHMTSFVQPVSNTNIGMSYLDDDQTERIVKGGTTYSYDLLGMSTEKDANGILTHFVKDDQAKYLGMRVATDSSNNTFNHYYYLTDHLGSVMAVTNDSGNKVGDNPNDNTNNNGLYRYDPYGNQLHNPIGTAVNNPIRWASGYFDADVGLYKFGTRYYSPGLAARWTQPDPQRGQLSNPMSLNPYLYGNSNPINTVDPSGRAGFLIGLAGLATTIIGTWGLYELGLNAVVSNLAAGCVGSLVGAIGVTMTPLTAAAACAGGALFNLSVETVILEEE